MKRVLIPNSHVTPAYSVISKLHDADYQVYTTVDSTVEHQYHASQFEHLIGSLELPSFNWLTGAIQSDSETSLQYCDSILELCIKHQISCVFPISDIDIFNLSPYKQLFKEKDILLIAPDFSDFCAYTHKFQGTVIAAKHGIHIPETAYYSPSRNQHYQEILQSSPLIVKAEFSDSSKYVWVVNTISDFESKVRRLELLGRKAIIQEYIPGKEEYSYHFLTDSDGKIVFQFKLKKNRHLFSSWSTDINLEEEDGFMKQAASYVQSLKQTGFWVIQTKKSELNGKTYFIELNMRFGNNSRILFNMINPNLAASLIDLHAGIPYTDVPFRFIKSRGISVIDNQLALLRDLKQTSGLNRFFHFIAYQIKIVFYSPATDIYHQNRKQDKAYYQWYALKIKDLVEDEIYTHNR